MSKKRVVFYSHDTFGLGHIRRTQKLANEIAQNDRSILIICASPKASSYSSSQGIEYLNLPGFTKQVTGQYVPRSLNIPIDEFVNLRASLILSAVRAFQPDVFIIDKEPLGVKKELLPALEYLKKQKKCKVVCGFRDILDEKEAVQDEWQRRDTADSLRRYFDHVLIYGEKNVYDFAAEYGLDPDLAEKLLYVGYVHPQENLNHSDFKMPFENKLPNVTLTLGGGGDGDEILKLYTELLSRRGSELKFNSYVLTGPFANPESVKALQAIEVRLPQLSVKEFVSDSFSVFQQSDLVVSMGGYNTMTELVSMGQKPIILPRVKPRKEQLIRASVFQKRGLCDFLAPEALTPESLEQLITQRLSSPRKAPHFPAEGLAQFRDLFSKGIL
ncbi:glycosyltransferase family protein [Bdellovibrio bacteriovorus]|uniref:Glycosyl transferase n=1 Tax=Bdellovibrio bacteriovorus str. Tiberius TaxID=1069642 RepID=K7Z049_BDEBC|nr:glycosyltransferase [Bdellovibrio bacteriovorus]AFY02370.1 glycosyl transferase [Bdellovibrio bacteriovorus str. Tiberius]